MSVGESQVEGADEVGDEIEAERDDDEQVVAERVPQLRDDDEEDAESCSQEKAGDSECTPDVDELARDDEVVDSVADRGRCCCCCKLGVFVVVVAAAAVVVVSLRSRSLVVSGVILSTREDGKDESCRRPSLEPLPHD